MLLSHNNEKINFPIKKGEKIGIVSNEHVTNEQ